MKASLLTNRGFTLVEMVIVTLIFVVIIGITGDAFNRIVSKSLSLNKTAETDIAGIVGLELMRSDLQAAGYGLPWSFSNAITYNEATAQPGLSLNDSNNVPRAAVSIDNNFSQAQNVVFDLTDILTIRGLTVAANRASKCWTYVESGATKHRWTSEELKDTDNVIVTAAIANMVPANQLIVNETTNRWNATFNNYSTVGKPPEYAQAEKKSDAYVIYGVSDGGLAALRMPFNRADYYVRRPTPTDPAWFRAPERCNPSAGVLVKGVVNQNNGSYTEMPILECVLDMQVVYSLQDPEETTSDIRALSAKEIRDRLKEIKVYILTHDGGFDKNYRYPSASIGVGPLSTDLVSSGSGSTYRLIHRGIPNWQNYHWRVYQIVARPNNLAGNAAQ